MESRCNGWGYSKPGRSQERETQGWEGLEAQRPVAEESWAVAGAGASAWGNEERAGG